MVVHPAFVLLICSYLLQVWRSHPSPALPEPRLRHPTRGRPHGLSTAMPVQDKARKVSSGRRGCGRDTQVGPKKPKGCDTASALVLFSSFGDTTVAHMTIAQNDSCPDCCPKDNRPAETIVQKTIYDVAVLVLLIQQLLI
jgi:hypothetical protein